MSTYQASRRSGRTQLATIRFRFDYWLLLFVAALIVMGMLIVYSASFDYGLLYREGDAAFFIRRQSQVLLIGVFLIVSIMQFDYQQLRRFSVPIMFGTLITLIAVHFLGDTLFGARRTFFNGSVQPAEFAKLTTILYIAHWLSSKGNKITDVWYGLVPFGVIAGFVCGLIALQPDLSTAALIAMVSLTLFFVAGADLRQFAAALAAGAGSASILVRFLPYAQQRLAEYGDILSDPVGSSYHVDQTLIALARGGWTGVGLGRSLQKFGRLPLAHTDGSFAVLAEELGLLGAIAVIVLFGLIVWRGLLVARRARDSFGGLLALGVTCWLAYQALINVAVITALIPFTGIPLPFLSYGGSSLLASLVGVGLLLNVSRDGAIDRRLRAQPRPRYKDARV